MQVSAEFGQLNYLMKKIRVSIWQVNRPVYTLPQQPSVVCTIVHTYNREGGERGKAIGKTLCIIYSASGDCDRRVYTFLFFFYFLTRGHVVFFTSRPIYNNNLFLPSARFSRTFAAFAGILCVQNNICIYIYIVPSSDILLLLLLSQTSTL